MSNTGQRIVSALVMSFVVLLAIYLGIIPSITLVGIIGTFVLHEMLVNFLDVKVISVNYLLNIFAMATCYICINIFSQNFFYLKVFNLIGLGVNVAFLYYLFFVDFNKDNIVKFLKKNSFFSTVFILTLFVNLSTILHFPSWKEYILMLAILTFSVDTAAWFWGKNFGKKKLSPKISPNKTQVGFFGGVITSVIISSIFWNYLISEVSLALVFFFIFLACCAQLGDLVQSKLKRQFGIKDSSNLIPGHGGFYDRVDSILFVSPLFLLMIKIIG